MNTDTQAMKYTLKSVLNTREQETNAQDIKLSNETKTLILCRARMRDVWNDVYKVLETLYGDTQVDRLIDKFSEAFYSTDNELIEILTEVMATTISDKEFMEL